MADTTGPASTTALPKPLKARSASVSAIEQAPEAICSGCTKSAGKDSIECEACKCWFHAKCVGLTKSDLSTLSKKGVHWLCELCDTPIIGDTRHNIDARLLAIEKKLGELTEVQKDSNKRSFAEVVSSLEKTSTKIDKQFKTQGLQIATIRDELSADNRAKNVIIFGIKGQDAEETFVELKKVCDECSLNIPLSKSNTIRLGKQNESGKPRPIRLTVDSESTKWDTLKRINFQKIPGIFARLDLSREEQAKDFQLRQELKKAREADKTGEYKIIKNQIKKVR